MPAEFGVGPPAAFPGLQPAAAFGRGGEAEPAAGGGQSEERTPEGDEQNGEAKHTHTCMLNTFMTYVCVCSGARRAFPECVRGAPSGSEQRAGGSDADPGTVQPAAHAAAASRRKCCRAS